MIPRPINIGKQSFRIFEGNSGQKKPAEDRLTNRPDRMVDAIYKDRVEREDHDGDGSSLLRD